MNIKKSRFNQFVTYNDKNLLFNTRTLSLCVLDDNEKIDFENMTYVTALDSDLKKDLFDGGFLIEEKTDEFDILKHRLNKSRFSNKVLNVTIAPTLSCNFKCTYCYQNQGDVISDDLMKPSIIENVIRFVEFKMENKEALSILWYGGEPLLGFEIIKELTIEFRKLCKAKGIKYFAAMVTNGYLLDKFQPAEFKELEINALQITIDGSKEFHDQRRMLKSNKGTYDRIVENIRRYSKEINISVRVNVNRDNVSGIYDIIDEALEKEFDNVLFYVAPVTNSNDLSDKKCFCIEEFSAIDYAFRAKVESYNLRSKETQLTACAHYCDADYEHGYVIDCYGDIYKCWSDIGNKECSLGNVSSSNQKNSHIYYQYMTYDATEDEECKDCKVLPLCMGGCPYFRIIGIDRCSEHKYLLDEEIINLYLKENDDEN